MVEVKNFKISSKFYVGMILFESGKKELLHNFQIKLVLKFSFHAGKKVHKLQ
jgi:hypothetical protein